MRISPLIPKITKDIVLILFVWLLVIQSSSLPFSDEKTWVEKRLVRDLFRDYEPRARPVTDVNTTITINFGIGIMQILELKESEQVLTTNLRNMYRWIDFHLKWKPEFYSNITHLNLPQESIWLPDIALYNSADERLTELRPCDVRISYNGTVEWFPMAITKSTCPVHIKHFPYDEQNCSMKFGPWTYDSSRVNMTLMPNEGVDLSELVHSQEWDLVGHMSRFSLFKYACCSEEYVDLKFDLFIKRQAAFYAYVLILPCSLLSLLTLVLFWLPPETPAKMILGMNIFVAFFLLLLLLVEAIPNASSSFPLIGNYYCMNMALVTLSTFLCLIVVNFHFRGDTRSRVPAWIRYLIIDKAAKFLLINVTPPKAKKNQRYDETIPGFNTTDSMIIRQSATHYRKKLLNSFKRNQENCPSYPKGFDVYQNSTGSSNKLNHLSLLAQNPETIHALIKCGFTEDLIGKLQNIHSLKQRMPQAAPNPQRDSYYHKRFPDLNCAGGGVMESVTTEDDGASDSADYCPACTGLSSLANQKGHYAKNKPNEDIGDLWAAAALLKSDELQDSRAKRKFTRQPFTSDDASSNCCLSSSGGCKQMPSNRFTQKPSVDVDSLLYSCLKQDSRDSDDSTISLDNQEEFTGLLNNHSRTSTPQSNIQLSRRVNTLIRDVTEIVKGIRFLQKLNENNEKVNKIVSEWRNVGLVLDRIFFIFYVIALVVGVICFFPRSAVEIGPRNINK